MSTEKTTIDPNDIIAILLDGKHVKYPIKFDAEEGWVEMQIPVQVEDLIAVESGQSLDIKENEETAEFYWKTVRKQGKVELIYAQDAKR